MVNGTSLRYSTTIWDGDPEDTTEWSADMKTLRFCRNNINSPLPLGSYWFTLNPAGMTNYFKASATGLALPETTIRFTVTADGSNDYSEVYTYYIPYFISGNGYWSGVGISNNSEQSTASVAIMLYNADGTLFSSEPPHAVPANGQFVGVLAEGQRATGWVKITSYNKLSGLCFMGSALMADIPFVSELSQLLIIPHVAQDSTWDTRVMVCNPNNVPIVLELTYYSKEGAALVYIPPQPLPALGSAVYDLSDIFSTYLPLQGGKVKLTVTQGDGVAAFALYMDQKNGGSYYAGISAVPQ